MHKLTLCLAALLSTLASAAVVSKPIAYEVGKTKFEGVLVYDDSVTTPRPGIVAVPNWMGVTPANIKQVEGLVGTKYVMLVADVYGKGALPKTPDDAGKAAGALKADRAVMRERITKAFEVLKAQTKLVDAKRTGAIGFCMGGTVALELARSGADLSGVVSFHAGLDTPNADDAKKIKGKVLALHGADDPFVPQKDVDAFETEMRNAKIDWQLVKFGNTVHSFTDVDANMVGKAAYNPSSTKRAYALMNAFFDELFTK